MKDWEDIIKERLEDCSCSLPEGSLEEFQRKLSSPRRPAAHRLAWLAVPAAAAVAAVAVLLPHHGGSDTMREDITSPAYAGNVTSEPVAQDQTAEDLTEAASSPDLLALAQSAGGPGTSCAAAGVGDVRESPASGDVTPDGEPGTPETSGGDIIQHPDAEHDYIPDNDERGDAVSGPVTWVDVEKDSQRGRGGRLVASRVIPVTGGLLGGVAAGTLSQLGQATAAVYMDSAAPPQMNFLASPVNSFIGDIRHYMPVRVGATARYPLTERLYLMSGVEYSFYRSKAERYLTGTEKQDAHYLGVPLRLDWSPLKRRHLDLYLGAGASADWCVAVSRAGKSVKKDGLSLSAVTAAGALYKFNSSVGFYIEPQLTWTPDNSRSRLETYRTTHPVTFGVATGLRFTILEK